MRHVKLLLYSRLYVHRFTSLVLIRLKENKTTPTKNKNKTKTPQILCILGGLQITQLIDWCSVLFIDQLRWFVTAPGSGYGDVRGRPDDAGYCPVSGRKCGHVVHRGGNVDVVTQLGWSLNYSYIIYLRANIKLHTLV